MASNDKKQIKSTTTKDPLSFKGNEKEEYLKGSQYSEKALRDKAMMLVAKGTKLLHSPKTREHVLKQLSSGNPIEKVGKLTAAVISRISYAIDKSGDTVPDEVKLAAATQIHAQILEIGEASGFVELDEKQQQASLSHGISLYMKEQIAEGKIDLKELAEEQGRVVQGMSDEERTSLDNHLNTINETALAATKQYGLEGDVAQVSGQRGLTGGESYEA